MLVQFLKVFSLLQSRKLIKQILKMSAESNNNKTENKNNIDTRPTTERKGTTNVNNNDKQTKTVTTHVGEKTATTKTAKSTRQWLARLIIEAGGGGGGIQDLPVE